MEFVLTKFLECSNNRILEFLEFPAGIWNTAEESHWIDWWPSVCGGALIVIPSQNNKLDLAIDTNREYKTSNIQDISL